MVVICIECGSGATLVDGRTIYAHRRDLWTKRLWLCQCGAYVGCHAGTDKPLGSPAGRKTRDARIKAHAAFDRLWRLKIEREGCSKKFARGAGYKWLAGAMDLTRDECHIGLMTEAQALMVVTLCGK